MDHFSVAALVILGFIMGVVAGRTDALQSIIHRDCDFTIAVYHRALCALAYYIDKDNVDKIVKEFIESASTVYREELKESK